MMWYRDTPFTLGGSGRAHLKVEGLSAGYGPFLVLRDLHLEAKPGLTVILGPNGAGKTTLLKALAGLGVKQAVLPPHERPDVDALRRLGFTGSDSDVLG